MIMVILSTCKEVAVVECFCLFFLICTRFKVKILTELRDNFYSLSAHLIKTQTILNAFQVP